jgi:hypothetical protein
MVNTPAGDADALSAHDFNNDAAPSMNVQRLLIASD